MDYSRERVHKPRSDAAAAFKEGSVKQTAGQRTDEQHTDRQGASALAKDGNLLRISAKVGDVFLDPIQRDNLIVEPVGTAVGLEGGIFGVELLVVEVAERSKPVVDGDKDKVSVLRDQLAGVIDGAGTVREAASVDEKLRQLASYVKATCQVVELCTMTGTSFWSALSTMCCVVKTLRKRQSSSVGPFFVAVCTHAGLAAVAL